MTHLKAVNQKAIRVTDYVRGEKEGDVVALQAPPGRPHIPLGCSLAFSPAHTRRSRSSPRLRLRGTT